MGLGIAMGGQVWHRSVMSGLITGVAVPFLSRCWERHCRAYHAPVVNAMIDAIDWRNAYLVFGATTALALFPTVYVFLRDRPEEIGEVRDGQQYVDDNPGEIVAIAEDSVEWTTRQMLTHPGFWAISVNFGSMVCVFAAVMLHLFSHLPSV